MFDSALSKQSSLLVRGMMRPAGLITEPGVATCQRVSPFCVFCIP